MILPARPEALALDLGDDRRALVARRRVEDGQEAARDEVEHAALVVRERVDVVLDLGRDDRVVVLDLRVVDHAPERELVEPQDEPRRCAYSRIGSSEAAAVGFSCGTRSPER